jgi:hypothetical protein
LSGRLALADLVARIGLVDDVDAALAAHDAAIFMARPDGLQRMTDGNGLSNNKSPGVAGGNLEARGK